LVLKTVGPIGFPEIEESYVVGAIVGAEPGSYTSVVDLYIHAFVIVICGVYWAYWFTRCISAVLAKHWYETCLHVREFTFPVAFYMDPLNCTPLIKMFLFVDWYVIF